MTTEQEAMLQAIYDKTNATPDIVLIDRVNSASSSGASYSKTYTVLRGGHYLISAYCYTWNTYGAYVKKNGTTVSPTSGSYSNGSTFYVDVPVTEGDTVSVYISGSGNTSGVPVINALTVISILGN